MTTPLSQEEKLAGISHQVDILLSEYKMVRDAVANDRQAQGQLENLALAGLGLSIPLILTVLENSPDQVGTILLIPILFFAIAFGQLRHERQLILNATYADSNLRPKIEKIVSQIAPLCIPVLEYEKYLFKKSWVPNLFLEWIAVASRAGISLVVGVGLIIVNFYLHAILVSSKWNDYEFFLLAIDGLMLFGNVTIAFFTGRLRYSYLVEQVYHNETRTKNPPSTTEDA